jgi:hypothetical protein
MGKPVPEHTYIHTYIHGSGSGSGDDDDDGWLAEGPTFEYRLQITVIALYTSHL